MKIVFYNGKGGAGKTTACTLTAAALAQTGFPPNLLDLDPQQTATAFCAAFQPGITDPKSRITLVDTPPVLDKAHHFADADLVVLVSRPSPPDLWTAQKSLDWLRGAFSKKNCVLLWNAVKPNTAAANSLNDFAAQLGISALPPLQERQCYSYAAASGWPCLTAAAREELFKLAIALNNFSANSK